MAPSSTTRRNGNPVGRIHRGVEPVRRAFQRYQELRPAPKPYRGICTQRPLWGNRLTFSTASQLRRDESYLPNANGEGYTFQGKLKFEVTPDIRLTASGLFDQRETVPYGGRLRFLPSAIPMANRDARSLSMQLSHNLNSGTFYTLTLGQFHRTMRALSRINSGIP